MKLFILTFFLVTAALMQLTALDTTSKVTVLNLFEEPVDIQIGDSPVLSIQALTHAVPSLPQRVGNFEAQVMYFKTTNSSTWRVYSDANSKVLPLKFLPTLRYLILFDKLGAVSVHAFVPIYQDESRLAVVNASQIDLKQVDIETSDGNLTRLSLMPQGSVSRFASMSKGKAQILVGTADQAKNLHTTIQLNSGSWSMLIIKDSPETSEQILELWQLEKDASLQIP